MPASYHLIMFIYYLGLWSRHLKSCPLSLEILGGELISNIWFTSLHLASMGEWTTLSTTLISHFVFTFLLILTFCSEEHAFVFYFIRSLLAIVFVDALNRVLFTYFSSNYCVWACFTLAYLRTMALIWSSFCFIKFMNLCEWNSLQRVWYIIYNCLSLSEFIWMSLQISEIFLVFLSDIIASS